MLENVAVECIVLPLHIQDTPQAANVKGVESAFLAHVGSPCLTAAKERADRGCMFSRHAPLCFA